MYQPLTEPEILFIKRADKPGDPWSGQMAFPGGHIGIYVSNTAQRQIPAAVAGWLHARQSSEPDSSL